jgi:hypothetical protein
MLPNFLIIGAARSGTTWISKNLELHPEIYIPRKKELHFFDSKYSKGMSYYESFFNDVDSATAVGEATPAYLHVECAAARIREHLPDVKMIVSLRNPVDRLYSRYWNARGRFSENEGLSFEEKIAQKPALIEEGFYVDHLRRYLDLFPREQLLILLFDDLVTDPSSFLVQMYRFLGVSEDYSSELLDHRINAGAAQKLLVNSRPVYWFEKAFRRMHMYGFAQRLGRENSAKLPAMASETRHKLVETYRDKNKQLEDIIERDLSHWTTIQQR